MRRSIAVYLTLPICFLLAGVIGQQLRHPDSNISKQDSSATLNAGFTRLFDLGLHNALADIFWVYTNLESDLDHYQNHDLNSWMHRRFELVYKLDPLFYENYLYGGQYLMIVKDDLEGAESLLAEGLKHYPDDLQLNWHMGFLLAFERRDSKRAYPFFTKVKQNPKRPRMFDTIYARLSSEILSPQDAFNITYESWKNEKDGSPLRERLGNVLYSIKGQIDLACLNEGRIGCVTKDFEGNDYINRKGAWISSKPLKKTGLLFPKKKD